MLHAPPHLRKATVHGAFNYVHQPKIEGAHSGSEGADPHLIPEADAIFGDLSKFPKRLAEGLTDLARTSPAVCKMLLSLVQSFSSSSRTDLSKPAEVTLTLVAFAQATPLILATRFALSCKVLTKVEGLSIEPNPIKLVFF